MSSRLGIPLLLVLALGVPEPLYAQQSYYLPHIADGQFAGGSIRTTFVLC